jgi:TPR repeat protein
MELVMEMTTGLSNCLMTLLRQQINLIATFMVLTMAISLVACTEKAEDSTQKETVVSTVPEDKIAQLQREAREGDPDAQYELAYLYENGLGVPKDETRALDLYQQAADQGHPAAQANLDAMSNSK